MARTIAFPLITDFNNIPERALVPEQEQPYKIPVGWKWVRLGSVILPQASRKPTGDFFTYIDIDAVDNSHQVVSMPKRIASSKAPSRASKAVHEGDTIFSLVRPYLRNIAFIDSGLATAIASTGFYVCSPAPVVMSAFLFRLLTSNYVVDGISEFMKGDNSPSVTSAVFLRFPVPLPPIGEQRRIVRYIDTALSRIDQVSNSLEENVDGYKERFRALIDAAVSGNLTRKWRARNRLGDTDWALKSFSEIADIETELVDPKNYQEYPHIAPDSISQGTGHLIGYRTIAKDRVTSSKHHFYPGQILYSKIRPYLAKVVIAEFEGLCSADMYPIRAKVDTRFLYYLFLSSTFIDAASNSRSRTVLPKINQKELNKLHFKIPPVAEQQEITRILDKELSRIDEVDEKVQTALESLGLMKQQLVSAALAGHYGNLN